MGGTMVETDAAGRATTSGGVGSQTVALLQIPDPRTDVVPVGWWETVARPAIMAADTWDELDEIEARLVAFMSYLEALHGDQLEFTKALRLVEAKRGLLLGPRNPPGRPPGNSARVRSYDGEASPDTQARWQTIAENWETLEPVVREATEARQVSQARLLRIVGDGDPSANGHRRTSEERARDLLDGVLHDGPLSERCVAALVAAGCRFVFERSTS